MNFSQIRSSLQLFIDKIDRLNKCKLSQSLTSDKISSFPVQFDLTKTPIFSFSLLEPDERDSFVLTLRLFLQKNDEISIEKMTSLLNESQLPSKFKSMWNDKWRELNDYLDSSPSHTNEVQTKRDLLKTLLYGDLAHTEKKYREKIVLWNTDSVIGPEVYTEFFSLLREVIHRLLDFRLGAKKAIELLSQHT